MRIHEFIPELLQHLAVRKTSTFQQSEVNQGKAQEAEAQRPSEQHISRKKE